MDIGFAEFEDGFVVIFSDWGVAGDGDVGGAQGETEAAEQEWEPQSSEMK